MPVSKVQRNIMSYPPPNPFTPPIPFPAYTCSGETRPSAGFFPAPVKVEEPPQYYSCRLGRAVANYCITRVLQGIHAGLLGQQRHELVQRPWTVLRHRPADDRRLLYRLSDAAVAQQCRGDDGAAFVASSQRDQGFTSHCK